MDRNYFSDKDADWVRVALRKESVDRNALSLLTYHLKFGVALRKESVDRNVPFDVIRPAIDGRSPQGERG